MKKFTKLILENEGQKYFEIQCELKLMVKADNEGEAGYLSDSILGSIEEQIDFTINNIGEVSKEDYKKFFENSSEAEEESTPVYLHMGKYAPELYSEKEYTDEEKILKTWEALFGDSHPTTQQKMEFYHRMREAGIDGMLVFKVLKGKI